MHALRNTPIKRKLTIIGMLTSGMALLLACLAFMGYELLVYRAALVSDIDSAATIISDNTSSALIFDDANSAQQTLRSLKTHPHVVGAAIYDKDRRLFAFYRRADKEGHLFAVAQLTHNGMPEPYLDKDEAHHFAGGYLQLFRRIDLDGENAGTVYIESDLQEIRSRMQRLAYIAVLVMISISGIAFLLSRKLHTTISAPVSHLANVVNAVAVEKDYSLRAVKQGEDELGCLIEGFNEMLQQIQRRDSDLQGAHNELEKRVDDRTKELAQSLATLHATLESSTDGIVTYQFQGGLMCHNTQYKKIWDIPDALFTKETDSERLQWIAAQLNDPEKFLHAHRTRVANAHTETFAVLHHKDGRIIEHYVRPQRVAGKDVGTVISYRDITARKHAEQHLENVHKQLIDRSRQAGMAEVATGVLHNVGNVLNSVNVSATLLTESAKQSKVASVTKLAALLQEHEHDLSAFFGQDPRGKLLPSFVRQLSQYLLAEQQTTLRELESLRHNIDHIKQIVTMQQSYSKVSGLKEVVHIADLVEDTLRMNEGSLQRHGIHVIREFAAVPPLNTEKHKILQILVNLVRNAHYACSEAGRADACMTLRIAQQDRYIKISVSDNGIGIAPENITHIFNHGFTTRKDGHGFGLHSGALAAQELGGALRAHSDGVGLGARFTLELPLFEEPA